MGPRAGGAGDTMCRARRPVPSLQVDDRRMKAVVDLPFVTQPSDIDRV